MSEVSCYKDKNDVATFAKGILALIVAVLIILPLLGDLVTKPKDQYMIAEEAGHFEPVVYDFKKFNERSYRNSVMFDVSAVKPKLTAYCDFDYVLAFKDNITYQVDMRNADEFTKSAGKHVMRNWQINGINTLDGVELVAFHHCEPDHHTKTKLYPETLTKEEFYKQNKKRLKQ